MTDEYRFHKNYFRCAIFTLFVSAALQPQAQSIRRQCISSYGSSVVTENVIIGQTAGQSFSTMGNLSTASVSQGFQQPNTFVVEEIVNLVRPSLNVSVYPNPASRSITIASEEELKSSIIRVTDINGKSLFYEKVANLSTHNINCASWLSGIYLITILDSDQNSKTLKLIISK